MKLLKKILLIFAGLVALLLVISLFLPSQWRVERSIVIKAPPETIYPYLAQMKKWPEWTAWTKAKDPTLAMTYSGPEEGPGATSSWKSDKMGNGTAVTTSADPKKGISFDLTIEEGKFKSKADLTLEPAIDGARITWANYGDLGWNPIARYFGLMFDQWIGKDYDEGLQNLKRKLEDK